MYLHFPNAKAISELKKNPESWIYSWEGDSLNFKNQLKSIGNFKTIIFFVGANNSGKSRFLRAIIKSQTNQLFISNNSQSLQEQYENWIKKYPTLNRTTHNDFRADLGKVYNEIKSSNPYFDITGNYHKYKPIYDNLLERINYYSSKKILSTYIRYNSRVRDLLEFYEEAKKLLENSFYIIENDSTSKIYIPILRSINENRLLKDTVIKETIKENYGIDNNVSTGLDLWTKINKLKGSGIENRKKIEYFENFLSKYFFDGKNIVLTADVDSKKILFFYDEVEHAIHEIGDGIQALIILLFPIFTANKNDWFLIEEPELNLHPGLQRVFIETLLNDNYIKGKNLKFFFTTHSNHFLDMTFINEDISI